MIIPVFKVFKSLRWADFLADCCSSQDSGASWILNFIAGWSSPVARQAHNLKAAGSNPAPATNFQHHSSLLFARLHFMLAVIRAVSQVWSVKPNEAHNHYRHRYCGMHHTCSVSSFAGGEVRYPDRASAVARKVEAAGQRPESIYWFLHLRRGCTLLRPSG